MAHSRYRTPSLGLAGIVVMLGTATVPLQAAGQGDSSPSRTVFKCTTDGQVLYTNVPCLGAQKIPVDRPPSGVQMRAGSAPREAQAGPQLDAWRARVGYDEAVIRVARTTNPECPHLAQRMALVEAEERSATRDALRHVRERLFVQRRRYSELGC